MAGDIRTCSARDEQKNPMPPSLLHRILSKPVVRLEYQTIQLELLCNLRNICNSTVSVEAFVHV